LGNCESNPQIKPLHHLHSAVTFISRTEEVKSAALVLFFPSDHIHVFRDFFTFFPLPALRLIRGLLHDCPSLFLFICVCNCVSALFSLFFSQETRLRTCSFCSPNHLFYLWRCLAKPGLSYLTAKVVEHSMHMLSQVLCFSLHWNTFVLGLHSGKLGNRLLIGQVFLAFGNDLIISRASSLPRAAASLHHANRLFGCLFPSDHVFSLA